MTLPYSTIIGLPVFTENKIKIGKIFDIEFNEKEHLVEKYIVKTHKLVVLIDQVLMVSPRQVIAIDEKKMIVENNVIKDFDQETKKTSLKDATTVLTS